MGSASKWRFVVSSRLRHILLFSTFLQCNFLSFGTGTYCGWFTQINWTKTQAKKKLWEYRVRRISFCLGFRLLKIQRKIYIANMALQYFITRDWTFINDKSVELQKYLLPKDVEAFSFGDQDIDPYQYFKQSTYGSRQYLLKEDISTLPQAIKHSRKYWVPNNNSKSFSVIIFFQNVCGAPFCYSSLVLSGNMADIQIWLTRSN